jgi:hypothetical protein
MAYNISDFLQSIDVAGVLHTNKFELNFVSPNIMLGVSVSSPNSTVTSNDIESIVRFRAESVRVPGVLLETADVNRYGVGVRQKMPYNAMFTDTSVSFISDKDGDIYRYFYTWINSIFDFGGISRNGGGRPPQYATEYKDDYTTDLRILIYNTTGDVVQSVILRKAFPVSFNEINLGWSQQNELVKVNVMFSFRDWTLEDVTNSRQFVQQTLPVTPGYTAVQPAPKQQPIAPDPTQNHLNPQGNFNSPTHKDGTQLPTFSWF